MSKVMIFLSLTVAILGGVLLFTVGIQSPELAVAEWGTDVYYQQLLKSDGQWKEILGNAIFDNLPVKSISKTETENILNKSREVNDYVLGLHTTPEGVEKWIEIDLSDLKLHAWEGNRKVYEFAVSTGRPGYKTPSGEFRVWRKVLSQAYRGGSRERGDYYYLPNVPFSLFFGGGHVPIWKGYAIHGAYWHNDFGIKNRSSGCVNLKPEEAGLLYAWAGPVMPSGANALNTSVDNPGVRVVIHE